MEPKQICCDEPEPPSLSANYHSFIAHNNENIQLNLNYPRFRINELLRGRRIRACFHGWVILSNVPDSVLWSLWNPLTSDYIRLPPLIDHKEKPPYEFCLSSPPADDERGGSVFLFTTANSPTFVFCRLDRGGKTKRMKWTEMSYAKQLTSIGCGVLGCHTLECLTCCNGKVYACNLDADYDVIVIQVDILVLKAAGKQQVVITLLPFVKLRESSCNYNPCRSFSTCYTFLKGSCSTDELFYIDMIYYHKSRTGGYVKLFRLDMVTMMWEEMEDLEDALFVIVYDAKLVFYNPKVPSSNYSGRIGGYVHFLGEMDDTILSSFHIKERTMHLSLTPPFVQESQLFVWAMLECGLEANHPTSSKQQQQQEEEEEEEEDKDKAIVVRAAVKGGETECGIATSTEYSHLLEIPFHILEMIMELCVGVEYLKFRATCKRCFLAAPSVQWSSETTLRRLRLYSVASPWLMVFDNNRGIITLIDPLYGERYFIKTTCEELRGDYQIFCSRFGWLLMHKMDGPLIFFNPFTSDIREIPHPAIYQFKSLCFSAPPTSPDCIVVGFTALSVYIIRFASGDDQPVWRIYELNFGGILPYYFHYLTIRDRDVYALCTNERIEAFRDMLGNEVFSWDVNVVDKASTSCCKSRAQYFLSNCDQHLLLVVVGEFGESVEVFKLNDSTKEWETMDDLGKHMIYISSTSCFCLEAKTPEMENKIYFPRLLENDKGETLVFYSLETGRYHTFIDKIMQESLGVDLMRTKYHCSPHTWIEPSWS